MGKSRLWSSMARRGGLSGLAIAAALAFAPVAQAQQIIPADFFSRIPTELSGRMSVSADAMVFNQTNDTVVAQGNVGISFGGYRAAADRAIYYQRTGRVELVGNVAFIDPEGVQYIADRIDLEDGFRQGFLEAMTVAFPDGSWFSATETSFDEGLQRIYEEGVYAPCGACIGTHGGPIGWKVRAARIITDESDNTIYFEQPSLELLGVPVAWLPWLTVDREEDIAAPVFSFDQRYGYSVSVPLFQHRVAGGTLRITPALFSRQGVQLALDWRQRIANLDYRVSASGIYQLDPAAYTGLGNREFRGAIQSSGTFRPTSEWTLGWSAAAFTDPGYMPDYRIARDNIYNEVYARYVTSETFADMRFQQFVPLGTYATWAAHQAAADQQALTHPNARGEHIIDLDDDMGRIQIAGRLLGLSRAADHVSHGFVHGYRGQSAHGMIQASWTNQWIVPGGLAVSPYLGLRADAADYDGASAQPTAPGAQTLLTATPIAALDVRYPLMARTTGATHIIEPIAQIVYRGSDTSRVGIINNDAQSTVFDTSNLFSFNRFSGADRQETGLRANVGATLQTSFDNGAWVQATLGQSHHLAGVNAFGVADGSTAAIGAGLDTPSSYVVASLEGAFSPHLSGGARMQIDPATGTVPSTLVRATGSYEGVSVTANYAYIAANPALAMPQDKHEVGARAAIPLIDYWSLSAGTAWDLAANQWLETTAGIQYDDRYLAFGAGTRFTGPTHSTANDTRFEFSFRLRAPANREIINFGYSWENE